MDKNEDEPCALAFTDFTKPSPILKGKDALVFQQRMEEAERLAKNPTSELITERQRLKENYLKIIAKSRL